MFFKKKEKKVMARPFQFLWVLGWLRECTAFIHKEQRGFLYNTGAMLSLLQNAVGIAHSAGTDGGGKADVPLLSFSPVMCFLLLPGSP